MKKILPLLLVLAASFNTAHASIYAFYNFTDTARDVSGNGHHAILHGNPTHTADRFGNPNSAYLFDGVNDYVEFPELFDFRPRTITLWFKALSVNPSTQEGVIFSSDCPSTQHADSKVVVNGTVGNYTLTLKIGDNLYIQPFNLNQWYHVGISFSDTAIRYYIDGAYVGTNNDTSNLHSGNGVCFATAGTHRGIKNYFNGIIDDIKINNNALRDTDIVKDFTSTINIERSINFRCFPNPASDKFYVESDQPLSFKLFDLQGKLLSQSTAANNTSFDVSNYPAGVYSLVGEDHASGILVRKLIVKQ